MSSKPKQKESSAANPDDLFMDQFSKEAKEAMLNRKMEEIRLKNQKLQRRHELIVADKKAAEAQGMAVSLKTPTGADGEEQLQQVPPKMRGVRVAVETQVEKKSSFATGRGRRLANMKHDAPKSQEKKTQYEKPKRPVSQGFEMPPDVTSRSFLHDDRRQGPLPENIRNKSARNRGNFGGADFGNVKHVMEYQKQRGPYLDANNKPMLELTMTGKERRDYVQWKQDRERIDAERMERAQREGTWKRQWDTDKTLNAPMSPPPSRLVPGRRPATRPPGTNRTSGRLPPHHDNDTDGLSDARQVTQNDSLENDSLVIQVVNDYTGSGLDGRGRGRGFRGRGRGDRGSPGGRGNFRGRGADFRDERPYNDFRSEREFNNRPPERAYNRNSGGDLREERSYSDMRDTNRAEFRDNRDYGDRGGYRGRGGDRGRGFRGAVRGADRGRTPRPKKGWAEWEAEQAERDAMRAGRGRRGHGGASAPIDDEILGRAIIVTTVDKSQALADNVAELPTSPTSPNRRGEKFSPNKLSGQSADSWDTTGTEESWETVDGDDGQTGGNGEIDGESEGEVEDEYAEDNYWDDGLQLHDQATHDSKLEQVELEANIKPHNERDTVGDGEVEKEARDIHNSSAESLERFIQEHTLHLNVNTGNLETGAADAGPNQTSTPGIIPLTPLKTPEGVEHVLNWAADASFDESSKPNGEHVEVSLNSDKTESPIKDRDLKSPKTVRFNGDENTPNSKQDQNKELEVNERQNIDICENNNAESLNSETCKQSDTQPVDNISDSKKDTLIDNDEMSCDTHETSHDSQNGASYQQASENIQENSDTVNQVIENSTNDSALSFHVTFNSEETVGWEMQHDSASGGTNTESCSDDSDDQYVDSNNVVIDSSAHILDDVVTNNPDNKTNFDCHDNCRESEMDAYHGGDANHEAVIYANHDGDANHEVIIDANHDSDANHEAIIDADHGDDANHEAVIYANHGGDANHEAVIYANHDGDANHEAIIDANHDGDAKHEAKIDADHGDEGSLQTEIDAHHRDEVSVEPEMDAHHGDELSVEPKTDAHHGDEVSVESEMDAHHGDEVSVELEVDAHHGDDGCLESEVDAHHGDEGCVESEVDAHHADEGCVESEVDAHHADEGSLQTDADADYGDEASRDIDTDDRDADINHGDERSAECDALNDATQGHSNLSHESNYT